MREQQTFFISDTHFFHGNVIKYCNRPWMTDGTVTDSDVLRMNSDMIKRWNNIVRKDDVVWHLGDFSIKNNKHLIEHLTCVLNGKINLVMGNHDCKKVPFYYECGFNRVYDHPVVIKDYIILSHEPLSWVQEPMFNIYGHVHDNDNFKTISKNGCCVCVERHNYTPVNMKWIKDEYDKLQGGVE